MKNLLVVSNRTKLVIIVSVESLKEYYFLYFLNSVGLRVFKKLKVDKLFFSIKKIKLYSLEAKRKFFSGCF